MEPVDYNALFLLRSVDSYITLSAPAKNRYFRWTDVSNSSTINEFVSSPFTNFHCSESQRNAELNRPIPDLPYYWSG